MTSQELLAVDRTVRDILPLPEDEIVHRAHLAALIARPLEGPDPVIMPSDPVLAMLLREMTPLELHRRRRGSTQIIYRTRRDAVSVEHADVSAENAARAQNAVSAAVESAWVAMGREGSNLPPCLYPQWLIAAHEFVCMVEPMYVDLFARLAFVSLARIHALMHGRTYGEAIDTIFALRLALGQIHLGPREVLAWGWARHREGDAGFTVAGMVEANDENRGRFDRGARKLMACGVLTSPNAKGWRPGNGAVEYRFEARAKELLEGFGGNGL